MGCSWKVRYSILGLLWLSFTINYLNRICVATVLPLIRFELGLTPAEAGIAMAIFFLSYTIAQIPSGYMADRIGARKVVTAAMIFFSGVTFFMGMIGNFIQFLFARILFGFGQACHYAPGVKVLANWFPWRERARAVGVYSTSFAVGPAITPPIAALISVMLGWRWVFYLFAIPSFIFVCFWWFLMRDSPEEHERVTKAELMEITEDVPPSVSALKGSDRGLFSEVFKNVNMWNISFAYFALLGVWWSFNSWLPSYLYEVRGLPLLSTGFFTALPWILGCISMPMGGWISDKLLKKRRKPVILLSFLVLAPCMYAISLVEEVLSLALLLCITGFFLQLPFGPFFAFPIELFPATLVGTAVGFQNTIGQLGSVTMIGLTGYIIFITNSYAYVFLSFAILALIGAFLTAITRQ